MKEVRAKIFYVLNNDPTIRSLLSLPPLAVDPITHLTIPAVPADAQFKIIGPNLPSNPVYPVIVFRRISTTNELRFRGMNTTISEMYWDFSIYSDSPAQTLVDDIKYRITLLFQDTQNTLTDHDIMYYLSEIVSDTGDAFQDEDLRWFSSMKLRIKCQSSCEITNNQ